MDWGSHGRVWWAVVVFLVVGVLFFVRVLVG